jgi:probable aminopeptidase NPEPL1
MTTLTLATTVERACRKADSLLLLAPKQAFLDGWHRTVLPHLRDRIDAMVEGLEPGPMGKTVSSIGAPGPHRVLVAVLPDKGSRHNSLARAEAARRLVRCAQIEGQAAIVAALDDPAHADPVAAAVARALPLFDRRTTRKPKTQVALALTTSDGKAVTPTPWTAEVVDAVRQAARLVDTPTADLTTADFVSEARRWMKGIPHVTTKVIVGEALSREGLGGIFGVGRAAVVPPRLLILDYKPSKASRTIALVGKGVVYDTGGLHLKARGFMESMKADMGGAAAVLGAFRVCAATRARTRIIALMPLAENAIDAHSYRPDDILTLHSGHTVEINNTDAEGRLLLGDAVSYACRKYKPAAVIDAATLTGAQLVATGKVHAAVVSNREGLERLATESGRASGDLCWPLPFAPEFFQSEFASPVADMRNSVKDRSNAQSSCAAQFVYAQIDDLDVPWLHVDLAGPAWREDRGTGFGVALLARIVADLLPEHLES